MKEQYLRKPTHATPAFGSVLAAVSVLCGMACDGPVESDGPDLQTGSLSTSWSPSTYTRAVAARVAVRYDDGPAWQNGAGCSGGLTAGATDLRGYLPTRFAGIGSIGGYNCRANTNDATRTSLHGTGRALDIMITPIAGAANAAIGDPIAAWLIEHAEELGVQYLIWNKTEMTPGPNGSVRAYNGPNPHTDHIHVELNKDAAARLTGWYVQRRAPAWVFASAATCGGVSGPVGDWEYRCDDPRTQFAAGMTAYDLIRLNNVKKNFRHRIQAFRDDGFQWDWTSGWTQVDPYWGWAKAFMWPSASALVAGTWKLRVAVDTGAGFVEVDTRTFTVTPTAPPTPFVYAGAQVCQGVSGPDASWTYFCVGPTRTFPKGATAYVLARINQVKANHRWRVEAWQNGAFSWKWDTAWNIVDPVWGWDRAFFWPSLSNAASGSWEFRLFIDTGSGFKEVGRESFTVLP